MSEVRPLPIYPWPTDAAGNRIALPPERDAILRAAKASLNLPFLIQPRPAVPESPGRILAFGQIPPFYHDEYVLIRQENVDKVDSVAAAMRHALTAPEGTPGAITGEMWLNALLGPGVKFLGTEPYSPPEDPLAKYERQRRAAPRFS